MKFDAIPKISRLFVIVVIGLILLTSIVFFDTKLGISEYPKRVLATRASLRETREMISEFHEYHQRYPSNLYELKEDFSIRRLHKEYISDRKGSFSEYDDLNGKGGWYYNNETGEVRVNIIKPIRKYLRFYFSENRNEIPSSW